MAALILQGELARFLGQQHQPAFDISRQMLFGILATG